jgi:alanine racemase
MVLKKDIAPLFKYNLTQTVCTQELAVALNNMGRLKGKPINVHIKVDTGMGRLGVIYKEALEFIKKIHNLKYLKLEGLFTHLACADVNRNFTGYQIDIFDRLVLKLQSLGINVPLIHAANSLGIISYRQSHFNMVRPGLILYGLHPRHGLDIDLKPLLSLKTKVIYVKKVPKGWGISYGHIYVTGRETRIVTLPIGYGDGYPRNLSNKGLVLLKGKRFKISGTVCMDQIMVDVGNLKVQIGDSVVLIGSQGKNTISTEELASLSGTIPYEIVCGLGSRVPRIYL